VLHPNTDGYMRSHVDATPSTFELLRETAAGDRVYRVRRGGKGATLKRRFRDDALRGATLRAIVSGPAGATLVATLNDAPLGTSELSPDARELRWAIGEAALVRGLNTVELAAASDGAPVELTLIDIDAGAGP
jgi:hypothetical protein